MEQNIEKNFLKEIRESLMMSKAELSRKADISPITIIFSNFEEYVLIIFIELSVEQLSKI